MYFMDGFHQEGFGDVAELVSPVYKQFVLRPLMNHLRVPYVE